MSGEARMARGALRLGALALPVAAGIGYAARGRAGAIGAGLGVAIAVANFAVAGAIAAIAGRRSALAAAMVGLPSYTVRMAAVLALLAGLQGREFLDVTAFAVAFGAGIVAVLAYECALWAKTPWVGMTFVEEKP